MHSLRQLSGALLMAALAASCGEQGTRITAPDAGLPEFSEVTPHPMNAASPSVEAGATSSAVISNGTVSLGINNEGHLNSGGFGVTYVPTGNDAIRVGCDCEGWGVADAISLIEGHASVATGGVVNVSLVSFVSTATTATSVVTIGNTFQVTHDFRPSPATPFLYQIEVTIENISGAPIGDLRYTRGMDWDVNPTPFDEFVTIQGTAATPTVLYADNNGFQNVNPLLLRGSLGAVGDFLDFGPKDHGAHFDLGFGALATGGKRTFTIFYGAAGDEATALAAIGAVGASVYSLGQPNVPGGPDLGEPNTFIFAYAPDIPRMTGGGSVFDAAGTRFTHGFELHCSLVQGPNNLQINWPKATGEGSNRFHLEGLTSVQCSDDPTIDEKPPVAGFDTYAGSGIGRLNGESGHTIDFEFTDAGEPGKGVDMATISIDGGAIMVSGTLQKGNHQAHKS